MLNVLFIGNSHTYLNFMPRMLLALVNGGDRGFELIVDQCTGEGASLEWHWKNPPSRDKITEWEAVHREEPGFDLHHRDGRHANPVGSYLTACVFYSTLFNTSPEGLPGTFYHKGKNRVDLDKDKALFLQQIAWETVRNMERGNGNAE